MAVFMIVNVLRLSDHIQYICWYVLYPQIEDKMEVSCSNLK